MADQQHYATNPFQLFLYKLVQHPRFEMAIFVLICLNMATLAMDHYQMTQEWIDALRITDIIFTSLFALEAMGKIIGLRQYYFKDAFNVFDFLVVLVSIVGFVLESLITLSVSPTLLRIVRVFRVFRVLRVVRAARGIRRLILTMLVSVPALFNIAVLLSVFLIIFAILGMNSFMNVKLTGALNDQVNFKTFGSSMLLLFRLVTSAGWNDVLDPLMNTRDCTPSNGADPGDCGDPILAAIYFVLLIFILFLVIVNMYIAIILENFENILEQDESEVTTGDFEEFYRVWALYDPRATQFVTLEKLSDFLDELRPPFKIRKPNEVKIGALRLPLYAGERVHCLDVLFSLAKKELKVGEIPDEIKQEVKNITKKYFPNRIELKIESTTLILRQQTKAAKMIQALWRKRRERRKNPESNLFAAFMQTVDKHRQNQAVADVSNTRKSNQDQKPASQEISETTNASDDDTRNAKLTDTAAEKKIPISLPPIAKESFPSRPQTVAASTTNKLSVTLDRPHSVGGQISVRTSQESQPLSTLQAAENKPPQKPQRQNFLTEPISN